MFCTHCGTAIPEGANFCGGLGGPLRQPAAAPSNGLTKCVWCGAVIEAGQSSCPRCGASTKPSGVSARAEWGQLPGRKDMAKLQFGNSFCQIEGMYVPVADMNLAAGDG